MTSVSVADIERLLYLRRLMAVDHHLDFILYTWANQAEPYAVGLHTRKICAAIDKAIECFRHKQSTFLCITVPFRHGKSEIISRKLPAHFLGLFPDGKVILCGHTAELTEGYSKTSRNLISTASYRDLFPEIAVAPDSGAGAHWRIYHHEGECFASGLLGSLSGQGYQLGILDDYCRNRADAESDTMREKMWSAFTNDFLTRAAPVSITIVLATPWHVDDIIGRIKKYMEKDVKFPQFQFLKFPAMSEEYSTGYLFPERFSAEWYEGQRASLGEYGFQSLMQLDPVKRGGNLLNTDCVVRHETLDEYPNYLHWWRVWDLAHTAKQRAKSDPDYTSGTLLAFDRDKDGTARLWIKDVCRMRENAPERDAKIRSVAAADGPYVRIAVENSLDAKDAVAALRQILVGKRYVTAIDVGKDKVIRATPLEPIFSSGNVHILGSVPWANDWIAEMNAFPKGTHDDQVDNISSGYELWSKGNDYSELYKL